MNSNGTKASGQSELVDIASRHASGSLNGATRPVRIALYSHDTMGLGHARRNLLLAQSLSESIDNADILLITGNRETSTFPMPRGTDCLTMPSIHKSPDGSYRARRLDLSLADLIRLRSGLIQSALESFQPDVFIVDNVPRGVSRELDPALEMLRTGGRTRCILGLRDILDTPQVVAWEWSRNGNYEAIRTLYDQVWIFGDKAIYDPVLEYGLPEDIASKIRFAGYLDQRARLNLAPIPARDPLSDFNFPDGRLALCMVGGGQDGSALAEAFVSATLPAGMNGILLTGPFMPCETRARISRIAAHYDHMGVLEFVPEPGYLLQRADKVIAMGGYNSVCEVLSHGKEALIVPRVRPREEQHIRAQRLGSLGLIDMCHPDDLCPAALTEWLARESARQTRPSGIDFGAVGRIPGLLRNVLPSAVTHIPAQIQGEDQHAAAL